MNNQLILNNMKTNTIQFHQGSAARDESSAAAPMLQDSAINHLELSLGMSSCSSSGIARKHNKNAPSTSTRKRMISFQPEELDVSPPAYKKSASVTVSSRLAFDYGYLFAHCPTGFVDPWSLAARQQKAAVEQAHFKNHPSSNSVMKPQQASVTVGWPPICSSRKNLISQNNSTKSSTSDEKDILTVTNEKRTETNKDAAICRLELIRPTLYVKVNMEGFSVGRKIDLSSFDSYESLSQALQQMFSNFLSNKLITKDGINGDDSEFILLYEDHEGDKILVGDVPWELFLTSVKRLYIARQSSAQEKASKESKDTKKEAAAT